MEKVVGKLKLQKRKIWDYFYFSDPDGDGTDQRMDRLSISAMLKIQDSFFKGEIYQSVFAIRKKMVKKELNYPIKSEEEFFERIIGMMVVSIISRVSK